MSCFFGWNNQAAPIVEDVDPGGTTVANATDGLLSTIWTRQSTGIAGYIADHVDNFFVLVDTMATGQAVEFLSSLAWSVYDDASYAQVMLLRRLSIPYGLAPPFTRPSHANRHKVVNARNNSAGLIGRVLQEQYFATTLHFKHLPMAWFDANFLPMLEYWKTNPVFFRWSDDYPQDDCLLWLEAKGGKFPEPRLAKGALISISLPVIGYV